MLAPISRVRRRRLWLWQQRRRRSETCCESTFKELVRELDAVVARVLNVSEKRINEGVRSSIMIALIRNPLAHGDPVVPRRIMFERGEPCKPLARAACAACAACAARAARAAPAPPSEGAQTTRLAFLSYAYARPVGSRWCENLGAASPSHSEKAGTRPPPSPPRLPGLRSPDSGAAGGRDGVRSTPEQMMIHGVMLMCLPSLSFFFFFFSPQKKKKRGEKIKENTNPPPHQRLLSKPPRPDVTRGNVCKYVRAPPGSCARMRIQRICVVPYTGCRIRIRMKKTQK